MRGARQSAVAAMLVVGLVGCAGGSECLLDTDCPLYERCAEGQCLPLGGTGGAMDAGVDPRDGGPDDAGGGGADAGAGDGGGDAGDAVRTCQQRCVEDPDCALGAMGGDYVCVMERCRRAEEPCSDNAECVARLSGWTVSCTGSMSCPESEECVDVGADEGRCAPSAGPLGSSCVGEDTIPARRHGTGDAVAVCGNASARCDAEGRCFEACEMGSCADGEVCNEDTLRCECAADESCATGFRCNTAANPSRCECITNDACEGYGRCADGRCVCTDDAECKADTTFVDTEWVCAPE